MSIVRIGLAETKKFAQGYEAIFGKDTSAKANIKKRNSRKKPKKPKKK